MSDLTDLQQQQSAPDHAIPITLQRPGTRLALLWVIMATKEAWVMLDVSKRAYGSEAEPIDHDAILRAHVREL